MHAYESELLLPQLLFSFDLLFPFQLKNPLLFTFSLNIYLSQIYSEWSLDLPGIYWHLNMIQESFLFLSECSHPQKFLVEIYWTRALVAFDLARWLISIQEWNLLRNLFWWIQGFLERWLFDRWLLGWWFEHWSVLRTSAILLGSFVAVLLSLLNTLLPGLPWFFLRWISVGHVAWLFRVGTCTLSSLKFRSFRTDDIGTLSDYLLNIYNSLFSACCSPYILRLTHSNGLSRCFRVIWSFARTSSPSPLTVGVYLIRKNSSLLTWFIVKDTWLTCWYVKLCFLDDRSNNLRLHCRIFRLNFWHFLHRYFSNLA